MAVKIIKQQETGFVVEQVKHSSGAVKTTSTPVPVAVVGTQDEPWCEVGVVAGQTINLGNYNSARISVSVKLPCHREDLDSTFDEAMDWVDERMSDLITQAKGSVVDGTDELQCGEEVQF